MLRPNVHTSAASRSPDLDRTSKLRTTWQRGVTLAALAAIAAGPLACSSCDVTELGHVVQPGSISGRVCDPGEARGILDATVYVVAEGSGTPRRVEARSDAEGRFTIPDVPVGTYTVFVERGSFKTSVDAITVTEDAETTLDESACLKPDTVAIAVFTGHDSVEDVLSRLGYDDATVVETNARSHDHEGERSWFVDAFSDLARFEKNDILFINCGDHEWALDNAAPQDVERALANLRTFVAGGGSIYFSDWAYDLFERLYPDAVDWFGDDLQENAAERGNKQDLTATVVEPELATLLGRDTASLRLEQGRIATPERLGPGSRALLTADVVVDDNGQDRTLRAVPLLLEHVPLDALPGTNGRVIFTSFHNGTTNTPDMDELLRAIVFSL